MGLRRRDRRGRTRTRCRTTRRSRRGTCRRSSSPR